MRVALALLVTAALLLSASVALAKDADTRDGFQLIVGAGIGYLTTTPTVDGQDSGPEVTVDGFGFAGMLGAGFSLSDSLSVGGVVLAGGHIVGPQVNVDGESTDADGDIIFNIVGPYVDWSPMGGGGGLRVVGIVGLGTMEDGNDDTDAVTLGFGGSLGLGWDWWVADDWAVGAMARVNVLQTSTEIDLGPGGKADVSYLTVAPALLTTLAWQ
jgi:hypothetical protein